MCCLAYALCIDTCNLISNRLSVKGHSIESIPTIVVHLIGQVLLFISNRKVNNILLIF